jgi:PAS domain-containing protein
MNFSLKHIKSRFRLQVVFFLLFCLLSLGIGRFVINQSKKNNKIEGVIEYLKNTLVESYDVYSNFRLNIQSDAKLMTSGKNNYTDEYFSHINNLRDTLIYLENYRAISKSLAKNGTKDSFLNALKNYETTFNYIVLGFKELGIYNSDNLNSAQFLSNRMIDIVESSGKSGLYPSLLNLKKYETDLLYNFNLRAYDQIVLLINALSGSSEIETSGSSSSAEFQELLGRYNTKINSLYTQLKRLDQNGDSGLVSEFRKDYSRLLVTFGYFEKAVLNKTHSLLRAYIFLSLVLFLLLAIIFSLIIRNIQNIVVSPLIQSVDFSFQLSKGKLLQKELSPDFKDEFNKLADNLNTINHSLKEKSKFVDGLLKQNFASDLILQGKSDTLGKTLLALKEDMRKAREEQVRHAEENNLRRFLNEGVAKFADLLRSNSDDLEKLSDVFTRELVKYLDAIQGGLFLFKEENKDQLYLASAFAYNRKKYITKTIEKGEGLIGTCALEMKTINLTEIPEDYIEITSGLGESLPRNLLLIPVMHEGIIIGVIEIASVRKIEPHQVEAGERIADSLASTIIAARINTRTAELLKKSQEQAAEMSEQEEEMRQNMEELKATQEESARREEELKGVLNALNKSFYILEYDTEGIICNANEKILFLLNLTLDKVLRKTHLEIFGKGSKADSLLFSKVTDGNTVELFENVTINNKQLELNNTFSPVQSKDGKTIKVLNIISINY